MNPRNALSSVRIALVATLSVFGLAAGDARGQGLDADAERARQLVIRIRKSMREVDSLLLRGAQPEKAAAELAANQKRIEELLKEAESKSSGVIKDIDDLIKMSKYQKSDQSSSSSSPDPSSKRDGKPSSDPGKQQPSREKSDELANGELKPQPSNEEEQQDPKNGGGQKDPKQNKPQQQSDPKKGGAKPANPDPNGDPKSAQPDGAAPEKRNANKLPDGATAEFQRTDLTGRWGMLPPKEAEDLQRRDADEFPQRYRQWMERYFRRIATLPSRDR